VKLANIESGGQSHVALVLGEELIDLTAQLGAELDDVPKFLALGVEGQTLAARCLKSAAPRLPTSSVKFLAPVRSPDKILGVGMNYHSFTAAARGIGMSIPAARVWFLRPRGCVTGPRDDVWLPRNADDFDYEVELAVVIGRRCRHISTADAAAVIGGYTVANDMTLRKQVAKSLVLAKSFDTHTPLGPWIVTPDEIGDPHQLAVNAWVNGELRQSGNTYDMIAGCGELIAELSAVCTLNPGDFILTGTPAGSGMFRPPPWGLVAGDVVKLEIERIGTIENRIVEEPRLG
jgi:2-keto-4-pentenoate hydratase/2-oxohepta-3-ene-1,7-dioic acid hydratase in catechol pathway